MTSLAARCTCFVHQISSKIIECIEARLEAEDQDEGGGNTNHLLNKEHTHIGIGVYVADGKLRYAEVGHG